MNRKKALTAIMVGALVLFVIACATTTSLMARTPLYTFRMEKASSEMNFLPTDMNTFAYTTEQGWELSYGTNGCCGDAGVLDTGVWTCWFSTCSGLPDDTCVLTCPQSCNGTCYDYTCPATCPQTCRTCGGPTCDYTCPHTCGDTCEGKTCWPPCP